MKTTTHKIDIDLKDAEKGKMREIEEWLTDKYGSHEQLLSLKAVRTGIRTELHVEYFFKSIDDAKAFYAKVIMKMLKDLERSFNVRIAGQTSCPSDFVD